MGIATLKDAVSRCRPRRARSLRRRDFIKRENVIAETGIDLISCGALTHSAPNFDVSPNPSLKLAGREHQQCSKSDGGKRGSSFLSRGNARFYVRIA